MQFCSKTGDGSKAMSNNRQKLPRSNVGSLQVAAVEVAIIRHTDFSFDDVEYGEKNAAELRFSFHGVEIIVPQRQLVD